jgi:hypothetical protein
MSPEQYVMQDNAQTPHVGCRRLRLNVGVLQLASYFRGDGQLGSAKGLQRRGTQEMFQESKISNLLPRNPGRCNKSHHIEWKPDRKKSKKKKEIRTCHPERLN